MMYRYASHYRDKDRHYHTLHHVMEMLELLHVGKCRGIDTPLIEPLYLHQYSDEIEAAIIIHDAIYRMDAPKGDNERASYELWREENGDDWIIESLVMATVDHMPPKDSSHPLYYPICVMIDLDLSPLGMCWDEFCVNTENLKLEALAAGISEAEWEIGRRRFVQSMLDRKRIFHTTMMYSALEDIARDNLKRSLL